MSRSHVIRLQAVWKVEPLVESGGNSAVSLASDSSDRPNSPHCVGHRFSRRFGLPTGLGPEDRVELVVRLAELQGHAWLNGESLGPVGTQPVSFHVSPVLLLRNLVLIEITTGSDRSPFVASGTTDFPGDVRLEITTSGGS